MTAATEGDIYDSGEIGRRGAGFSALELEAKGFPLSPEMLQRSTCADQQFG
jgi:hypothetical protein